MPQKLNKVISFPKNSVMAGAVDKDKISGLAIAAAHDYVPTRKELFLDYIVGFNEYLDSSNFFDPKWMIADVMVIAATWFYLLNH